MSGASTTHSASVTSTGVAQLAAVIPSPVLRRPHQSSPANRPTYSESQETQPIQDVPRQTLTIPARQDHRKLFLDAGFRESRQITARLGLIDGARNPRPRPCNPQYKPAINGHIVTYQCGLRKAAAPLTVTTAVIFRAGLISRQIASAALGHAQLGFRALRSRRRGTPNQDFEQPERIGANKSRPTFGLGAGEYSQIRYHRRENTLSGS